MLLCAYLYVNILFSVKRFVLSLCQYLFIYILYTLFYPFRLPCLGKPKATAAARAVLPNPTNACWIFLCFCNPPNTDMDYRIFNVCTWPFLCVCVHTGVGHTDSESAHHFWRGKTHKVFLCSYGIRTLVLWILSLTLYQFIQPPCHPYLWILHYYNPAVGYCECRK